MGGDILHSLPDWPWSPSCGYWVFFLGLKQLGHGVDHPPQSNAEVEE